eukprot:4300443-Pyramimonas_sp.AAC.1
MDEIDAIMSSRDGAGEHEASRRMKTELLIQMDGLAKSNELVKQHVNISSLFTGPPVPVTARMHSTPQIAETIATK